MQAYKYQAIKVQLAAVVGSTKFPYSLVCFCIWTSELAVVITVTATLPSCSRSRLKARSSANMWYQSRRLLEEEVSGGEE